MNLVQTCLVGRQDPNCLTSQRSTRPPPAPHPRPPGRLVAGERHRDVPLLQRSSVENRICFPYVSGAGTRFIAGNAGFMRHSIAGTARLPWSARSLVQRRNGLRRQRTVRQSRDLAGFASKKARRSPAWKFSELAKGATGRRKAAR